MITRLRARLGTYADARPRVTGRSGSLNNTFSALKPAAQRVPMPLGVWDGTAPATMVDGRSFRILTVIDHWNRESVSGEPRGVR